MKLNFVHFTLSNGLKVYVHEDHSVSRVAINLLYNVGARDEDPEHTGFAHLFEHLMFGGSKNIPFYDEIAERIGAENNAFTDNDITNYYLITPSNQLETAFWLESDRMYSLDFSEKSLSVQRNVVCEEFKQRYLNQPYGDAWLKLRPLVYKRHPYQWATIGKNLSHIENATLQQVKDFFYSYYIPNNCILSVAGDCTAAQIEQLAEKWFGSIPAGKRPQQEYPQEPEQTQKRTETIYAQVPLPALYVAYRVPERKHPDFYALSLLSDMLTGGKSAYLYQKLVKEKQLCNSISTYVTGNLDPGMFVFHTYTREGVSLEVVENEILEAIMRYQNGDFEQRELEKVKNQMEFYAAHQLSELFNKAFYIAYYAHLGNADWVNTELERYFEVTPEDITRVARQYFKHEKMNVLRYLPQA
ncbi:MAG: insulinase family protein [Bacteroidia bacterium]|nr:insulinase family protein [Bacteroidia bacterium]MDW8347774.1 pitrilysin family protein [Bacteroidia bacterium]